MTKYNVELADRTPGKFKTVIKNKVVSSEHEAAETVKAFIAWVREKHNVTSESRFDTSPRGYAFGQTLYTADAVFDISTGRM